MPYRTEKLLIDITIACRELSQFTDGKSYDDFQKDRILQLAIEREFEIEV